MTGAVTAPPWPEDATVPRWAQHLDGTPRRPRRHRIVEDTRSSDRYHIALYNDRFLQHLVFITEPGPHSQIPRWERTARDLVRSYPHLRPLGRRAFNAAVRYQLTFDGLTEIGQGRSDQKQRARDKT